MLTAGMIKNVAKVKVVENRRSFKNQSTDESVVKFGDRVKRLRIENNLIGSELCERAKIAPSTLSKIENNRLSPTYDTIAKLARGLGVNVEKLFFDPAPKEP